MNGMRIHRCAAILAFFAFGGCATGSQAFLRGVDTAPACCDLAPNDLLEPDPPGDLASGAAAAVPDPRRRLDHVVSLGEGWSSTPPARAASPFPAEARVVETRTVVVARAPALWALPGHRHAVAVEHPGQVHRPSPRERVPTETTHPARPAGEPDRGSRDSSGPGWPLRSVPNRSP